VKRLLMSLALTVVVASGASVAHAHDAYDDSESHPLRLVAYAVHPAGWLAEWLVARPVHFLVSQPQLEPIFGHVPHESAFNDYEPYDPDRQP
jgi:hypothetical protein